MTEAVPATVQVIEDGDVRIVKVGPMGPYGNNAYIIRDTSAHAGLLVDMPLEEGPLLDAIAAEGGVHTIVASHWHQDHWATYDAVRAATGAPVLVGDAEVNIPEERINGRLADGQELRVGGIRIDVLHTPGHTPGSISLKVGRAVITGDTLFGGGPGRTFAAGDLETILASIDTRLLPLPGDTVVMPGHGGTTTVADARAARERYRRHPRRPGFFGDVEWGESQLVTAG
jgi:glyoxylase-like metal-dependent hydrolase (beta-lactamase superfamily II)